MTRKLIRTEEPEEGLDLTFRLPTLEELEELEHPKPLELVIPFFIHGALKEVEET